jgi:hypothetical protein
MQVFSQRNQVLEPLFGTLRTLFSTIYVHTACALPKNTAGRFSRLNSITLMRIKVLAHNLFHKICEESPGRLPLPVFPGRISGRGGDYTSLRHAGRTRARPMSPPGLPAFCACRAFRFGFKRLGRSRLLCAHRFPQIMCKA